MLVFALREQFNRVRAFTFVDEIHEVTDRFERGADPARTMAELAASARHASLWGRTNYGRAFTRFADLHADALGPKTNLLVLGDARSNHTDLALPVVADLVHAARHSWWLNPEHSRNWEHRRLRGPRVRPADGHGRVSQSDPAGGVRPRPGLTGPRQAHRLVSYGGRHDFDQTPAWTPGRRRGWDLLGAGPRRVRRQSR